MEESEDNLSLEDIKFEDGQSTVKVKPKKRSLVERELETNLTARVTSPISNRDATSTSRYGRALRIKTDSDTSETIPKSIKSPKLPKSPNKVQSPAYKMHASNSPIRVETPKSGTSLENQIDTIYNENISLSRFACEEKKNLSTSKYPKVYIRKDLIQSKEKDSDDTIVLIKNMFSPSNSAKKPNNFNVELSSEKYNKNKNKQSLNGYAKTPSVVKTLDFDGNKKNKSVEKKVVLSKNELFELEAKCEYQVGDLAWARMGTYPFWPCIITRDPLSGMYVKKKLFGRIERDVLHVTFFGDNGRRGWIVDSMLRKFLGQLEFETARMNFTSEAKKKDPRLYSAYFISDKKMSQWKISVDEAEMLLREPKRLRIDILNDMLEKARSLKTTPKHEKSKKVTRTNSDVSLSESLYDTLFSEEDFTTKESERSRSKSRNRSLDVSEVVTACLDNMAAKTGITKIQRQSHMDRWLQKAKSKTPEKSQLKSQVKVDNKSAKSKTRVLKGSKRTYNFRSSSQESLEESKLLSHQNEHDYSQKSKDRNSPILVDNVEIDYKNVTVPISDPVESGSGLGIISKVETLCSKDQINDDEEMVLTVINNEIYISEAGEIGDEICIQLNQVEDIQTHNLDASDIKNVEEFKNCSTNVSIGANNDLMETEDQCNEDITEMNKKTIQIKDNTANDGETIDQLDENVNEESMDVSESNANVTSNEDQLENNDLNVKNNENVAFIDHEAIDSTKMSVDEFMDVDNENQDCEKDKCKLSVPTTLELTENEYNLDSIRLINTDRILETVDHATKLSDSHEIIVENKKNNHETINSELVETQTAEIKMSQAIEKNVPENVQEKVPQTIEEHIPQTTKENVLQSIEGETSQAMEENVLPATHENIAHIVEKIVSETIEDTPQTIVENVPQIIQDNKSQAIEGGVSGISNTLKEEVLQIVTNEVNISKTVEEKNTPVDNHFLEFGTIESHAKKKNDEFNANISPSNRNRSKKLHKFKLSLNKSLKNDKNDTENVETAMIGCDSPKDFIEKESLKLNGYCDNTQITSKRINDVGSVISSHYAKQIEITCEKDSIVNNTIYLDGDINGDIIDEEITGYKKAFKNIVEEKEEVKEDDSVKIIEQVTENDKVFVNGCHESVHTMPAIVNNEADDISLDEPVVLNGIHEDIDVDANSIGDNDEPLSVYQMRLKSKQSEGNEKIFGLEKPEVFAEELDNLSVKSGDSEMSVGRLKRKEKLIEKKKILEDPEFLKYLEIKQDAFMDEHPDLSEEEITNHLYKTWLYEEDLKTEAKKADDIDQSNLVKGLNEDPVPVKKIRKKIKTEKEKEPKLEKEPLPKEKSKRRIIRPYYKEDFSDMDDDIEYYEIFKPRQRVPKVMDSQYKDEREEVIKEENFQNEIGTEIPIEVDEEYISEEIDQVEEYFRQLTEPKPNLFKGLIREKVCEICEKYGNLVKCKGCYSMFHVDCVKKQVEVVEVSIPMRGRKKKKKNRGRKPKEDCLDSGSQSDEKSQDANVSEEMLNMSIDNEEDCHITANEDEFESKLSEKMKEVLENLESIEYDSDSNDEHDFADVNIGECKIVDVKQRKKEQIDYSDFKCNNCQKYDIPICFVCKSPVSPKNKAEHRQKCQVAHCHKYYHMECLDHWPQTQFNGGEISKTNKGNEYFEALSCPRHVCHTCVCDDPRGCKTRFSGDKLARCVRCPATYHTFTKCLPAGSQILSGSHIICPRHYEHRPGKVPCHVNTGWCFICALGGSLICCEYCPTSFHAECLNIKPPEGGYMCEDCETGRLPLYGEMVWVKLGHYRWWPGIVLHPSEIPQNILAVKHSPGEFVVRFFGQYDHYWVNRGRVFPFQEGDSGKVSSQKSKIDAAFTMAMEHAQRACEILKTAQPNEEESQDIASSLLPPHYVKLRVNKPCGALCGRKMDLEEGSLTQCECDPNDVDPCGPYTQCLNRMLLTECGPTCRAGDRCNNRAFEKRLYPKMTPYRTPHRGWGLKTLVDIKAGQFVIEYVGELIDEDEFQRRMKRKHEVRDENFYFLTLDKERVIDAGPKGNFARFMNHSCEPNCETQKWTVLGDIRVGLFALYDIPANSELTFNYNLESAGIEKKRCMCGAKRCSGYIGAKPKQDDQPKKNKLQPKRTYKKRKNLDDSPSTSQKPKNRIGRPYKPRELTDIEKDLLIIKNATNSISSDSECSGRLSSFDSTKDNKSLKRKKIFEDISPKRIKMESE